MRKRDKLLFVREPFLGAWTALAEVLLQDMLAKMRMVTVYLRGWRCSRNIQKKVLILTLHEMILMGKDAGEELLSWAGPGFLMIK
ncbi:hypothetical protein WN943_014302 [Citrus x changshan-huyou]